MTFWNNLPFAERAPSRCQEAVEMIEQKALGHQDNAADWKLHKNEAYTLTEGFRGRGWRYGDLGWVEQYSYTPSSWLDASEQSSLNVLATGTGLPMEMDKPCTSNIRAFRHRPYARQNTQNKKTLHFRPCHSPYYSVLKFADPAELISKPFANFNENCWINCKFRSREGKTLFQLNQGQLHRHFYLNEFGFLRLQLYKMQIWLHVQLLKVPNS